MSSFNEDVIEKAALQWLTELGYQVLHGPGISPGGTSPERADFKQVLLVERLRSKIFSLNPGKSPEAWAEAYRLVEAVSDPSLVMANRAFHQMLTNGVEVAVTRNGEEHGEHLWLVDFEHPENNDFLAVNQFTIVDGQINRRPDIVLFVNGIPLAVIELKNLSDANATIDTAFNQLQTYQLQIPKLFHYNELQVISDGGQTQIGCITTPRERFAAWKTIDGDELLPSANLETTIKGVFEKRRFLDLIRSFIVFEDDGKTILKKVAQYHQFHAVRKALSTALKASGSNGDGKGGVLWHTQGSGKSLTMLFFAGKLIRQPAMANPTIVMLTDRNDLDDQLHGTFSHGKELLRQAPLQAEDRDHLRELLVRHAGGVIFTTIQKFFPDKDEETFPMLSDRRNIIIMADEAHRTQYGFGTRVGETGKFVRGFASHLRDALPNATFVAFTGTPLQLDDRDTRLVFGDYIDIYDVQRAVEDGATVPIYYESRLIKLDLPESEADLLDDEFEELTEELEDKSTSKLASRWTQLEAVVGTPKRLAQVAADLVQHIERRQEAIDGKVMIVGMSRRICVDLYDHLIALRPEWDSDSDESGSLKVIMTGSATDDVTWQRHIRNKERRDRLADNFKNPDHPFKIVIVRDMWLTGFDAPALHTIYIDKPMKGHGLMQAIARVNRVFRDKPGGLVVDYLGIANNLKQALRSYIRDDGSTSKPIENDELDIDELVGAMIERLEICREAFHGFDYSLFLTGSPTERLSTITDAEDFLFLRDRRNAGLLDRYLDNTVALLKAFALASSTNEAQKIKTEVAFFQTVKAALSKTTGRGPDQPGTDFDHALRQLIDQAIMPEGVVDIFAAAGLEKPNISVISDTFLAELKNMPQRNLALELLKKLLNDEIKSIQRSSVVQSQRFSEKLEESITRYHNRAIETAQVIEALIELAKEMRASIERGEELGLSKDELAFYDALADNASAMEVLGDEQLRLIAREVAVTVRNNTSIDWTIRESAQANLRRYVRRVLHQFGYPPDMTEGAIQLVIQQAEVWARETIDPPPIRRG